MPGRLKRLIDIVAVWLASGGGVGFIGFAPGTWGTLVAIPLLWFLQTFFSPLTQGMLLVGIILVAIWTSGRAQNVFEEDDPGKIVIDEIAGFLLAMLFVPLNLFTLVCGFLLFRIFDIAKVPPANVVERINGGLGVVGDDLVAGGWTYLILRLLLYFDIATSIPTF